MEIDPSMLLKIKHWLGSARAEIQRLKNELNTWKQKHDDMKRKLTEARQEIELLHHEIKHQRTSKPTP